MNDELLFRPIAPEDDAVLAALIRRSLSACGLGIPGTAFSDPGLDHLSAYYAAPGRVYDVLLVNGETVGGVGFEAFGGFPECAELQKLYLEEALRGRGIGQIMLRHAEDRASAMGFRRVYLETHTRLSEAIRLYESAGYRAIPRPASVVHGAMDRFYLRDLDF